MSITVTQTAAEPKLELAVIVHEGGSETRHTVTLDSATFAHLAGSSGASAEALVRAVFAFLLEHEPKESILARFDVTVVQRYFPEFEAEIPSYLAKEARSGTGH